MRNVYCHSAGGGKYLVIMQVRKRLAADEGRQRQAALAAFAAFSELKHVILVDDDVDIFDTNDVLWAMTTRYPGRREHGLHPRRALPPARPVGDARVQPAAARGRSELQDDLRLHRAGRDCASVFERAQFADVELKDYEGLEDLTS